MTTKIIAYRADSGACWYYRIHLPLSYLTKNNPEYEAVVASFMDKRQIGVFDVAILQRQYRPPVLNTMLELQEAGARLIYEIDDDLFAVPKWNPAYEVLGKRRVRFLVEKFLEKVDAVFVTTEYLATIYRPYNENIFVLPNSVSYEAFQPPPQNSIKPVVLWQGSNTHHKDLQIMAPHFTNWAAGGYLVKMWSADFPDTYKVPFVDFKDFHAMFSQMDAVVGVAPLVPNTFNRSKSNLKFLEYSAQGMVTVASNFGPYENTILHGETGFLVGDNREWTETVRMLVHDRNLREKILQNAQTFVRKNFDLTKNYVLWQQAIDKVMAAPRKRTTYLPEVEKCDNMKEISV